MNTIQTILHPTDFSIPADHAFRLARSLARDHEARLLVLHVVPAVQPIVGELIVVPPLDADEPAICGTKEFREKMEAKHPNVEGLEIEYRLEQGDPVDAILRVADEEEAGLIVLGTHGRTGLDRVLMGSVAEKVVRKAPASVLTVKTPRAKPAGKRVKSERAKVAPN